MKTILKGIGIFVTIELLSFLVTAYIYAEINPFSWDLGTRVMQSIMGTMLGLIMSGLYLESAG